MKTFRNTLHIEVRAKQRGRRKGDLDWIHLNGTQINKNRFMVTDRDFDSAIADLSGQVARLARSGDAADRKTLRVLRSEIKRIDALRGWIIVAVGAARITVYPSRHHSLRQNVPHDPHHRH